MPLIRIALLVALAALSTGCLRVTFTLNLRPDGSGTIVQTMGMTKAGLASAFGTLAAALEVKDAKASDIGPIPFLTEQEVKETAAALGARFVSLKPADDPALEGQTAIYAFDDIRKLPLTLDAMFGSGLSRMGPKNLPPDSSAVAMTFTRQDGRSTLVLDMPVVDKAAFKDAAAMANPGGGVEGLPEVPDETAKMMREILEGFYIELAINVDGTIVSTDAPFVDGSKIVLLQMDFGEMLKAAKDLNEIVKKMEAIPPGGPEREFQLPGLKIATQQKIRIEFR